MLIEWLVTEGNWYKSRAGHLRSDIRESIHNAWREEYLIYFSLLILANKVTDGVRCGDKWSSALLNNLEFQLVERLQSYRNFGDVFGQRFLQQVMTKNVPRCFQNSWLYRIEIWGRVTSRGVVRNPNITKYGHKFQWLQTWPSLSQHYI